MTLIDFALSNARRFYSSMGNPSDMKGVKIKWFPRELSLSFYDDVRVFSLIARD